MKNWWRQFRQLWFNYQSLARVEIHRDSLVENIAYYRKKLEPLALAPVLKSNAYGHGLAEVARIVDGLNCPLLVVDSYYEALMLRNEGIRTPLLVVGQTWPENIIQNRLRNVSYVVTDLYWLRQLSELARQPVRLHLKFDTGMNRQGMELEDFPLAVELARSSPNLVIEGICSHLAEADGKETGFSLAQIKHWNQLARSARQVWPDLRYWHLGASSSLFYKKDVDANLVRLGLGMYGVAGDQKLPLALSPVVGVKSIISSLRTLKTGERVGYNGTFTAKQPLRVATVPLGYFEGVDRRLSNCGYFRVKGEWCPIVGNVSMNITSIDVSAVPGVQVGDEVEVVGRETGGKNSVVSIARLCDTIPYEIMAHIERKMRRVVV